MGQIDSVIAALGCSLVVFSIFDFIHDYMAPPPGSWPSFSLFVAMVCCMFVSIRWALGGGYERILDRIAKWYKNRKDQGVE